jgi:hypothetical protein
VFTDATDKMAGALMDRKVEVGGKLGEVLVSEGKISPEELEEALAIHREEGRQLGEVLYGLRLKGRPRRGFGQEAEARIR